MPSDSVDAIAGWSWRTRGTVAALCAVQFVDVLGVTVVVTALPQMLRGVGASQASGALVATGYAMFFGGLLMFGARLGDRFGHRRVILASLLAFAAGSVVAATAVSIVVLTAGRCLQGAAAAAAVPSALRLLTEVSADDAGRSRAIAAWSASGAAAGASGFVVGGVVGDLASWRWIFWAFVAVAAVLVAAILRAIPEGGPGDPRRRLSLGSSAVLTAAVMAVVVGTTLVGSDGTRPWGAVLLAAAVVLAVVLWRVDGRSAAPLLPSGVLRRTAVRRGVVGSWLNTATTSSASTLVTLYVQDTLGRSALAAAAVLLPFSLAVVAGSVLAARLARRLARERSVALGLGVIAAGTAGLVVAPTHLSVLAACSAVAGLGIGVASVAATSLGTDTDLADRATASGMVNTAAQLGTAIGVAALLALAVVTTGVPAAGTRAPDVAWATAAVVAGLGAVGFTLVRTGRNVG